MKSEVMGYNHISKKKKTTDSKKRLALQAYQEVVVEIKDISEEVYSICDVQTLADISQLEDRIVKFAKKVRKARTRLFGEKEYEQLDEILSTLKDLVKVVYQRYIRIFNNTNSVQLNEEQILLRMNNREFILKIHRVVFAVLTESIIPEYPRDEYKYARSIVRHFVIHSGGTNTGKTYNALEALKNAKKGIYLGPLRLLALEVYHKLNEEGTPCSLSTGEEDIVTPSAKHTSSTIEKLKTTEKYDIVVIDEAQMISDKQRGHAWTTAILGAYAKEIHVCCSENAVNLLTKLIEECNDSVSVIEYIRDTELKVESNDRFIFPKDVRKADALIVFSKRMVMAVAAVLREENINASLIYGDLPPEARRSQVQLFLKGETDVVVATDAIGMGLNLPIRRIVYIETMKFDGEKMRLINASEIKQISGRAGRKNIYDTGYINSIDNKKYIANALNQYLSDLSVAYYLPSKEYILEFPIGTLEERLFSCMYARRNIKDFAESEIKEQLALLFLIERLKTSNKGIKLNMEEEYSLAFIPFDSNKTQLTELWIEYVEKYALKEELPYPELKDGSLEELELFYKELSLYYSFAKTMNIRVDIDKVLNHKSEVSERIHEILRKDIIVYGKTCRLCGKKLPYNYKYGICQECYYSTYYL